MIEWLQGKITEVQALILAGIVVAAILVVAQTWWRTRSLISTLSAFVLAGAVVWGSANILWFRDKIGQETGLPAGHRVVAGAPAPSHLVAPLRGATPTTADHGEAA